MKEADLLWLLKASAAGLVGRLLLPGEYAPQRFPAGVLKEFLRHWQENLATLEWTPEATRRVLEAQHAAAKGHGGRGRPPKSVKGALFDEFRAATLVAWLAAAERLLRAGRVPGPKGRALLILADAHGKTTDGMRDLLRPARLRKRRE